MELDRLLKEAHDISSKPVNSDRGNTNDTEALKQDPKTFNGYYLTNGNHYLYVEINEQRYYYQLGQEKALIDFLISHELLSVGLTIQLAHYYMDKKYVQGIDLLSPKVVLVVSNR